MNTPTERATLYRKAAETIEMCAKHGIKPIVKLNKELFDITRYGIGYVGDFDEYEFPVAVIEGHLVWADTVVYNGHGCSFTAGNVLLVGLDIKLFTLLPPKRTVMVELREEVADTFMRVHNAGIYGELAMACRKALDNLKDN